MVMDITFWMFISCLALALVNASVVMIIEDRKSNRGNKNATNRKKRRISK